jgi:DNA-binding ferritin-like protein
MLSSDLTKVYRQPPKPTIQDIVQVWKVVNLKVANWFGEVQAYDKARSMMEAALKIAYHELENAKSTVWENVVHVLTRDQNKAKSMDRIDKVKEYEQMIENYTEQLRQKSGHILTLTDQVKQAVSHAHSLADTWTQAVIEYAQSEDKFTQKNIEKITKKVSSISSTTLDQVKQAISEVNLILKQYSEDTKIAGRDSTQLRLTLNRAKSHDTSAYIKNCITTLEQFVPFFPSPA